MNVWSRLRPWAVVLHVALSVLIWATLVALATVSQAAGRARRPRGEPSDPNGDPTPAGDGSLRDTIIAYVRLTKPRIIVLLLITTVPAMILAAQGIPSAGLLLATLLGGTLAAGSANAINMYLDRDIDEIMRRTRRPAAPGARRRRPIARLRFGFVLGAVVLLLPVDHGERAGGDAGALGDRLLRLRLHDVAEAHDDAEHRDRRRGRRGAGARRMGGGHRRALALPAWILFAIIFVWTPPHFWALSMRFQGDYAAAGVPMLPVVKGEDETRRQIFLYSLVLFGTTLLLYPIGHMGPIYLATAIVLGGVFVYRALRLWREPRPRPRVGRVQVLDRVPGRALRRRRARRARRRWAAERGQSGCASTSSISPEAARRRSARTPTSGSCPLDRSRRYPAARRTRSRRPSAPGSSTMLGYGTSNSFDPGRAASRCRRARVDAEELDALMTVVVRRVAPAPAAPRDRGAPRRPDVDDHDLAPKVGEGGGSAVHACRRRARGPARSSPSPPVDRPRRTRRPRRCRRPPSARRPRQPETRRVGGPCDHANRGREERSAGGRRAGGARRGGARGARSAAGRTDDHAAVHRGVDVALEVVGPRIERRDLVRPASRRPGTARPGTAPCVQRVVRVDRDVVRDAGVLVVERDLRRLAGRQVDLLACRTPAPWR